MAVARPTLQAPAEVVVPARVDYLAFAQGAMPIRVGGSGAQLGAGEEQALRAVDGNPAPFTVATGARADTVTEFVYELPALTTFDRFAVPDVLESVATTSTFVRSVEVLGSVVSPDAGFTTLASAALTPHAKRGEWTELTLVDPLAVRWVRLRLTGGLDMAKGETIAQFTELVGNGMQEPPSPTFRFRGDWGSGTGFMAFKQQGSAVSGCFDVAGELQGTVSGTILRAVGVNRTDKVRSAFVLGVAADGTLRGVRAVGMAPFRPFIAPKNSPGLPPRCSPAPVTLACGAVVHAVGFARDSADLLPDPSGALTSLAEALRREPARLIVVEGHVSTTDGTPAANLALSERRAQAVVSELVRIGLPADRVRAVGVGSARPIATSDDEAGRAINRRIEIHCS